MTVETTPTLASLTAGPELTTLLVLLFEESPPLHTHLVPAVLSLYQQAGIPSTYTSVMETCVDVARDWDWRIKADFLSGHPLIGEFKGANTLSDKEQEKGGVEKTSPVVFQRLAHLNALYSKVFPHLVYVTFVAGRPREAIVPEMETLLGIPISPVPIPPDWPVNEPALDSELVHKLSREYEDEDWKYECERGLEDVWRIGVARLAVLGVE